MIIIKTQCGEGEKKSSQDRKASALAKDVPGELLWSALADVGNIFVLSRSGRRDQVLTKGAVVFQEPEVSKSRECTIGCVHVKVK